MATSLWSEPARLDRIEALRLYTQGSAWFFQEQERKGALRPGQFADVAVLSADYFSVDDEEITAIESVLTIMDGEIVFAQGPFSGLAPPPLPVEPDWSLIEEFGGAYVPRKVGSPGGGGGLRPRRRTSGRRGLPTHLEPRLGLDDGGVHHVGHDGQVSLRAGGRRRAPTRASLIEEPSATGG